ncbi:MAG: peptidylprolyl isomerase [Actinophytocola sp.]|uniref:peptidylprolyl isomerase n=1 Tax=Actinophytocola sp. TaxID=1872138 RepID=UPI003D69FE41
MRTTVAWVGDAPVDVSDVDRLEAGLRRGPVAATLPRAGSQEGRQLRRWLVQVVVAERLVAAEAAARGLATTSAPALVELAPDRSALLGLGSVAAELLTRSAAARAVFAAVTAEVSVPADEVERYYRNNPECHRVPEERVVREPLRTLRRGELTGPVEKAVFAARPGEVVGPVRDPSGWHTLEVVEVRPARVRPPAEVASEIAARLLSAARRRGFTIWLAGRTAARVRLAPGFEHPGDPDQPDNTHRH